MATQPSNLTGNDSENPKAILTVTKPSFHINLYESSECIAIEPYANFKQDTYSFTQIKLKTRMSFNMVEPRHKKFKQVKNSENVKDLQHLPHIVNTTGYNFSRRLLACS